MSNNQKGSFAAKLDNFFGITKAGSTIKTEVIAGVTTFMTMCYILMVNAGMFGDPFGTGDQVLGVSYGAIYIATGIAAIVGTVLMGLLSKLPFAQASGMGLNAFFVYTVCVATGLSYAAALVVVLISGILFLTLTIFGVREKIFKAIPRSVRIAIPAGIGLFIAFIGLQNAGIVVNDDSTLVNLVSMNFLKDGNQWGTVMPVLVTFFTFILIAVLSQKKVKGSILWGMLIGTAMYYILGASVQGFYDGYAYLGDADHWNPINAFKDFGTQAVGQVFVKGFTDLAGQEVLMIITSILAFAMVDMFDTIGTLYGACSKGGMLDENGNVPKMKQAMLADSIATCTGAILGTSTVTTYVESSAGVAEGGRTGFTSMVVAALFLIALFISPVAELIPGATTAAALMYVGVLMLSGVKEIDWSSPEEAVPAFLTLAIMPFTYNISYGIALGLISYCFVKLFQGKIKDIHPVTVVIAALFIAMFFLTH